MDQCMNSLALCLSSPELRAIRPFSIERSKLIDATLRIQRKTPNHRDVQDRQPIIVSGPRRRFDKYRLDSTVKESVCTRWLARAMLSQGRSITTRFVLGSRFFATGDFLLNLSHGLTPLSNWLPKLGFILF